MEKEQSQRTKMFRIGEILLKEEIITKKQLAYMLHLQKKRSDWKPLGELAIELGYIWRNDFKKLLRQYKQHLRIGELFIELGLIGEEQLAEALKKQKESRKRLGEILIDMGLIKNTDIVKALSMQLGIPRIEPNLSLCDVETLFSRVNERFLRKHHLFPAFRQGDIVTVIMSDPLDETTLQSLEKVYNCQVEAAIATRDAIDHALSEHYSRHTLDPPEEMQIDFESDVGRAIKSLVIGEVNSTEDSDRIVNIVNYIISNAIKESASDIHIEPQEKKIQIRYRIDGILQHKTDLPRAFAPAIASRVKVICGLDIAEKRKHQDGRIEAKVMGHDVDLRVSTYVSVYGETIVIRVLNRNSTYVELNHIGMTPALREQFEEILNYPSGVVLVTGPTGSGKSTTLYASLNYLNDMDRKIITVEDPVEYTIEGVIHGRVNPKIDLSYVEFIKSMMRQDPDILMIGEIRERESAEATIQAALTGHKVFSTFHTEDTTGALVRLIDMGIDPFLVSSTVVAILAQRLLRRVCTFCKARYDYESSLIDTFQVLDYVPEKYVFYKGKGCDHCGDTGFRGRTGVFELLMLSDSVRNAILQKTSSGEIRRIARQEANLVSMREYGLYKALKGETTPEEVLRIVSSSEEDAKTPRTIDQIVNLCEPPKMKHVGESIRSHQDAKMVASEQE